MTSETAPAAALPEGIAKILRRFATLTPDLTRQALVQYSSKLAPLPERFRDLDREQYAVHECMTPVAIYPEIVDGKMYYYADVPQSAPTIRALLAMIFEAVNGQPPATVQAIPADFVRQVHVGHHCDVADVLRGGEAVEGVAHVRRQRLGEPLAHRRASCGRKPGGFYSHGGTSPGVAGSR